MGSAIGELTGANRAAARAGGKAAKAQEAEARRQQQLAIDAADSPQQMAALDRQLATQEKSLARQEKLVGAIDPAIIEASQQALQLLQGKDANATAPLRRQRERQRQRLQDSLREQLGPGAESSSAGLQALKNFDAESDTILGQAQQSSLSQVFGIAQAGGQQRLGQVAQGFGSVAQGFGNVAGRKVGAVTGTGGNIVNASGSQFAESALRAQQQQGIGSDIFKTAMFGAGGGFGGGGLLGKGGAYSQGTKITNNFDGGKFGVDFNMSNPFGDGG